MELLERLLFGSESLWGGGVAHSVMILALVIALGIMLGKVKIAGVSLGVTGILFVGIAFSYFGMNIDEHLMHFLKEFGLILFVYSIGLQVGPGFFSSFRKGGITLNKLAVLVVALGVVTTVALYYVTGLPMTTMVGVMSGAVRAKLLNWPMLRRRSAAATGFCSWRRPKMPRHWSRCSAGRWMPVR